MEKFDYTLFRCSSLVHILTEPKGKSNYQLWDEYRSKASKLWESYQNSSNKYHALADRTTKTALKIGETMENWSNKWRKAADLETHYDAIKNDIKLSEGCKSHLLDMYITKLTGRSTKDLKSKYLEKGLAVEEKAITVYSAVKGRFYEKCLERKSNGWITGEIDFLDDHQTELIVCDAKSSWDLWTFFRNIRYVEEPELCPYYSNMQGYMWLWDVKQCRVIYVLIDTPDKLIEQEKRNLKWNFIGTDGMYAEACEEIEFNLKFGDIPLERRVIEILIERNDEYIERIPKVITACRKYLNNIKEIYYETD